MTQQDDPPPPCHLCHSQNFDKIDSFLKPTLNICILGNLIVGWGGWVIKGWAGIAHQTLRFSGGVNMHKNLSQIYITVRLLERWTYSKKFQDV